MKLRLIKMIQMKPLCDLCNNIFSLRVWVRRGGEWMIHFYMIHFKTIRTSSNKK